jgi:hypothetical protein
MEKSVRTFKALKNPEKTVACNTLFQTFGGKKGVNSFKSGHRERDNIDLGRILNFESISTDNLVLIL